MLLQRLAGTVQVTKFHQCVIVICLKQEIILANTSIEFDRQFVQTPSMFLHDLSEVSWKRDMSAWLAHYVEKKSMFSSPASNQVPPDHVTTWPCVSSKRWPLLLLLLIFQVFLLQVNFVAAIDVYEDGEAGLLLCYNCEYLQLSHLMPVKKALWRSTPDWIFCSAHCHRHLLLQESLSVQRLHADDPVQHLRLPLQLEPDAQRHR